MAAEAQKVITGKDKPGAQEMSLARLETVVDDILRLLEDLPPAYRLHALRMAEEKVKPLSTMQGDIVRKVSRYGRIYVVSVRAPLLEGSYKVSIVGSKAVYEIASDSGDVKVRRDRKSSLRIPIPKWVYEALGEPLFVRVRIEGSRIIVEPA